MCSAWDERVKGKKNMASLAEWRHMAKRCTDCTAPLVRLFQSQFLKLHYNLRMYERNLTRLRRRCAYDCVSLGLNDLSEVLPTARHTSCAVTRAADAFHRLWPCCKPRACRQQRQEIQRAPGWLNEALSTDEWFKKKWHGTAVAKESSSGKTRIHWPWLAASTDLVAALTEKVSGIRHISTALDSWAVLA